jgi:multidrug efflux pump
VVQTLLEAMVLVFLVMYLFLQNVRYTVIPAIVAPIALLGTLAVMLVAGFSINVLTMFGMVLAIGIIVDDAIVVVENVERIMAEEACRHARPPSNGGDHRRHDRHHPGADRGVHSHGAGRGSVGVIYRQFTLAMAVSILFSAFLALSLTPALCATLLKPVAPGHHDKRGFFGAFNRAFARLTRRYESLQGR